MLSLRSAGWLVWRRPILAAPDVAVLRTAFPPRGLGAQGQRETIRGLASTTRVKVELDEGRQRDPLAMLNIFRRKCRQNQIYQQVHEKRRHKKPGQVERERKLRYASSRPTAPPCHRARPNSVALLPLPPPSSLANGRRVRGGGEDPERWA
jgi:ribosomal protein S21